MGLCCEEGDSHCFTAVGYGLQTDPLRSLCAPLSLWPAFSYEGANHPQPSFSVKGSLVTLEEEKLSC